MTSELDNYDVLQAVEHTPGLGPEVWQVLAKSDQIRNQGEYEGDLGVDDRLVKDLIAACEAVRKAVGKLPPLH